MEGMFLVKINAILFREVERIQLYIYPIALI